MQGWTVECSAGQTQGARDHQEDTYLLPGEDGRVAGVFGVLDGHGYFGAEASAAARDVIASHLRGTLPPNADTDAIKAALVDAFAEAQSRLEGIALTKSPDRRESGTTAVIVVMCNGGSGSGSIVVGHVGDSKAMLCRRSGPNGTPQVVFSTRDHTLFDEGECKRVVRDGGRIYTKDPSSAVRRVIPSESSGMSLEEIAKKRIALNMARSLGHHTLSRFGVSSVPEITGPVKVCPGDVLVLASDGLSRFLDGAQIAETVLSCRTSRAAAPKLLTLSLKLDRAKKVASDNTTVLLATFSSCDVAETTPVSLPVPTLTPIPTPTTTPASVPTEPDRFEPSTPIAAEPTVPPSSAPSFAESSEAAAGVPEPLPSPSQPGPAEVVSPEPYLVPIEIVVPLVVPPSSVPVVEPRSPLPPTPEPFDEYTTVEPSPPSPSPPTPEPFSEDESG